MESSTEIIFRLSLGAWFFKIGFRRPEITCLRVLHVVFEETELNNRLREGNNQRNDAITTDRGVKASWVKENSLSDYVAKSSLALSFRSKEVSKEVVP